jgi:hypothetical protein
VSDDDQSADEIKQDQLTTLRECLNRQRPFGEKDWQAEVAAMLDSRAHSGHGADHESKRKVACPLYDSLYDSVRGGGTQVFFGLEMKEAGQVGGNSRLD